MDNGGDYWKEKYEQDVLGKPKPKEYIVKEFVTIESVAARALAFVEKEFNKKKGTSHNTRTNNNKTSM